MKDHGIEAGLLAILLVVSSLYAWNPFFEEPQIDDLRDGTLLRVLGDGSHAIFFAQHAPNQVTVPEASDPVDVHKISGAWHRIGLPAPTGTAPTTPVDVEVIVIWSGGRVAYHAVTAETYNLLPDEFDRAEFAESGALRASLSELPGAFDPMLRPYAQELASLLEETPPGTPVVLQIQHELGKFYAFASWS